MCSQEQEEHCYSAGGWPSRPVGPGLTRKGGDEHADYFNISCVRNNDHGYCKTQQPPLGKVTVVM